MADKSKAPAMKSAYELALERLERQGIAPPREESLTDEERGAMAELRQQAAAKLAELEILHRDRWRAAVSLADRQQLEEDYVRERQRIEQERERKIELLRVAHQ